MQNEVHFDAIEFHAKALANLSSDNRSLKRELYDILKKSDVSEDLIVSICFLLTTYERNSEELARAVEMEKKRQMTPMQKLLSIF